MSSWLESLAVASIAFLGFLAGRWFSGLPKHYWLIGYIIPLGMIVLYCVAMFQPRLAVVPPVSWMMIGRIRFACFAFVVMMVLSTPLRRLPRKRDRFGVYLLMVAIGSVSVLPFFAPVFNRSHLAGLKTRLDTDGVCRQSNDYTCGPAAAVTALRRLGLPAEEGEIAILAHTSSLTGTEPDVLANELQRRFGPEGLTAEYRAFKNIEELRRAGLTVAVVKFDLMLDHCVTVLGVESNRVSVADPLSGLTSLSVEEFEKKWQFVGVVLKRSPIGRSNM